MITPELIFRLVPNPRSSARDINLSADQWLVLTSVNGKHTVAQIAQSTRLPLEQTVESMEFLLREGLIALKVLKGPSGTTLL
jgi:hypothetical protein